MRFATAAAMVVVLLLVFAGVVSPPAHADVTLYNIYDLGLGGSSSWGMGINDSGQVTGYALTAGGAGHAFLYSGGGDDGPGRRFQCRHGDQRLRAGDRKRG